MRTSKNAYGGENISRYFAFGISLNFRTARYFAGVAVMFLAAFNSQARTFFWNGNAGDNNWRTAGNWTGSIAPANNGTAMIVLTGTNQLTSNINAPSVINSLVFSNNAGPFVLGGNSLTIRSGGIINSNANPQTINNPIALQANQTWNAAAGMLTFNGNINNTTNLLTVTGISNSIINGVISGTGGLTKGGPGRLTLNGANTFTGGITIRAGTFALGTSNVLADASTLTMNGGTFSNQGYNETLGALTNKNSSMLALGNFTTGTLSFASGSHIAGTLTIKNWTGTAGASGMADRVFILASPSATFLTNITFFGYAVGAIRLGTGEIVPSGVLAVKPDLGTATTFAVLAGSTITSGGATVVNGDLGLSPGTAVTGAPTVNGSMHQADAVAAKAKLDLTSAYNDIAGQSGGATISGDIGGQTFTPGIYKSITSLAITSGDLTLDARGDPNAVFIFQMGSTFITAINSKVILTNGAQSCNIFWQVGSSVTLGGNSVCEGNMLVFTSIGVGGGATINGRALAQNGAVTLVANNITIPSCPSGQIITFPAPDDQIYGVASITLDATASSELPVNYSVTSGPATVSGNTLTIAGVGPVEIQTSQAGNADWIIATPVSQTILVAQKILTVVVDDTNRVYGAANPSFTASFSDFVNGDTTNVIQGLTSFSTSATNDSNAAGSPYSIDVTDESLSATNYTFSFVNGQLTITLASATNVVLTSANPSLAGSNVTFTATVTAVYPSAGTPTGTVLFLADGGTLGLPVTVSNGIASVTSSSLAHGTHIITVQYAGDDNFIGSTNSLNPYQVIGSALVVAPLQFKRYVNSGFKVRVATLLVNASDPNDDALTFVSVSSTSAAGGVVLLQGGWINYEPSVGFTNADSYSYVVADSAGLQATGTVAIATLVTCAPSQNVGNIKNLGYGSTSIHFNGIPGQIYTIQFTENLQKPDWQSLGTATADAFGKFDFTDLPAVGSPPRLYRSTNQTL